MMLRALFCALLGAAALLAELPDFYKKVERVTWVVPDLAKTIAAWRKAGLTAIEEHGELAIAVKHKGQPVSARWLAATAYAGDLGWDWVQPLSGDDAFAGFLRSNRGGVMALMHRVPSPEALDAEVARLGALGVGVLQQGEVGPIRFVYFDTGAEGKYVLGLTYDPRPPAEAAPGPIRVTQFAFVARDFDALSAYWEKLGFPKMAVTHSPSTDRRYRGKPADFDMKLGWHRHGKIVYEWALPLKGPTTYEDHLKAHGEGFHHFGVAVDGDMDAAIARWESLGYPVAQSGGWGETGKPGSGRFAYIDTDPIGGALIELLWNYRPPEGKK
ncbi:MAG: VOC family protein [Acidobacteria bacterium]|nr:VOC family protein [Acidobacteriota bacterium]